jgi:putative pyruvate formate lyase activating enzyme
MNILIERKIRLLENNLGYFLKILENCTLCPRNCKVNRVKGDKGFCGVSQDLMIYTAFLHKGEEPPISGDRGSGTIFFSGCSLKCIYCQNYRFSHNLEGKSFTEQDLAEIMLNLQLEGAHNINLVTPTHFLPQILKSLLIAYQEGLNLPIVYNSSGYEKEEIIARLEGIVDIYLPDMKYFDHRASLLASKTPKYCVYAKKAILEMYRQKKKPLWRENLLTEGIIIRHLVLPSLIDNSKRAIKWIKKCTPKAYLSVMFQYRPYFNARESLVLNRELNYKEYKEIIEFLEKIEPEGWVQEFNPPQDLAGVYFTSF